MRSGAGLEEEVVVSLVRPRVLRAVRPCMGLEVEEVEVVEQTVTREATAGVGAGQRPAVVGLEV